MGMVTNAQSSSSKTGVRYHPMIIRYCLGLAGDLVAMYDEIRFDGKINSGFVILPSRFYQVD